MLIILNSPWGGNSMMWTSQETVTLFANSIYFYIYKINPKEGQGRGQIYYNECPHDRDSISTEFWQKFIKLCGDLGCHIGIVIIWHLKNMYKCVDHSVGSFTFTGWRKRNRNCICPFIMKNGCPYIHLSFTSLLQYQ